MDPVTLIENLIRIGTVVKEAASNGGTLGDWDRFIASPEFAGEKQTIVNLIAAMNDGDVQAAIRAIESKQAALRGSKGLAELPTDKLIQYGQLGDARLALAAKRVAIAADANFFGWLVHDALPVLVQVAPTVLALLV